MADSSSASFQPSSLLMPFTKGDWMSFLQDFVDHDQGLESLDFITQDGLDPESSPY
jgi:hypothetical protein